MPGTGADAAGVGIARRAGSGDSLAIAADEDGVGTRSGRDERWGASLSLDAAPRIGARSVRAGDAGAERSRLLVVPDPVDPPVPSSRSIVSMSTDLSSSANRTSSV